MSLPLGGGKAELARMAANGIGQLRETADWPLTNAGQLPLAPA
jgi:hypothetical protein